MSPAALEVKARQARLRYAVLKQLRRLLAAILFYGLILAVLALGYLSLQFPRISLAVVAFAVVSLTVAWVYEPLVKEIWQKRKTEVVL